VRSEMQELTVKEGEFFSIFYHQLNHYTTARNKCCHFTILETRSTYHMTTKTGLNICTTTVM